MIYYTTKQVMDLLNVNRSRISVLARLRGWHFEEIPSRRNIKSKRYLAADIEAEMERRKKQNVDSIRFSKKLASLNKKLVQNPTDSA